MTANHYRSYATRLIKPSADGIFLEPSPRWIRGYAADGTKVVDSKKVYIGWEGGSLIPFWAFPKEDISQELVLNSNKDGGKSGSREKWYDIRTENGETIENAAWQFKEDAPGYNDAPKGLVIIDFKKLSTWLEDDEKVVGHARSPYSGIHTRLSSREVEVVIDGVTVAKTNSAIFLYENGHPTRYYINATDVVGLQYFRPSTYHSACAYKGVASYFSATVNGKEYENIVWTYLDPASEVSRIQGRWSFWNETVDIYVDGEKIPRPERYIIHTSP